MSTGVLAPSGYHVWMNGALVFEQARVVIERRCPAQTITPIFYEKGLGVDSRMELAGELHCFCCQRC